MTRLFRSLILLTALWFLTAGLTCETRQVEVPVLGTAETPIQIETDTGAFSQDEVVDLTDIVQDILDQQDFDQVIAILLESVTYTITDNESAVNTMVSGEIQVSSSATGELRPLIEMSGVNLTDIADVEQSPDLNAQGVLEINRAISPLAGGGNVIYIHVGGTATPAPPPLIRFKIVVKVTVTVVGLVETEVPVL